MVRETVAPGWSTVPAAGVWTITVGAALTVVVVTGGWLVVDAPLVVVVGTSTE